MSVFRCKQFSVRQSDDVYKITSDTTLIGAWARLSDQSKNVLEIGCGSGMISLMLAQRYAHICIDAIDINAAAAQLTADNFQDSPWSKRLSSFEKTLQEHDVDSERFYDDIISNPPYHNSTTLPPNQIKSTAKHDHSLSFEVLIERSASMLSHNGSLHLIIPSDRCTELLNIAKEYTLTPSAWCEMSPRLTKSPKRTMLSLTKEGSLTEPSSKIIMYDTDGYHEDFKNLLRPFLIIF